jgi:DNA-binding IclR family transcriptional regulator
MKRPKSDYAIQPVTNALLLLEAFRGDAELGVTELARRLDLHKHNVFRLLATLEQKNYVEQCANDRYRLGVRCLELGQAFARTRRLVRLARPRLESLVRSLGESAHLAALNDFEVVHLDGEQPDQLVLTGLRLGLRLPAYCTALGKILLGFAGPEVHELLDREVISRGGLEPRTPATITDREKFIEHLRAAAAQGFATDFEECVAGMCCAAAPIYDASSRVVAAISVSGPTCRLDREALLRDVVPAVCATADDLSHQLGHEPIS